MSRPTPRFSSMVPRRETTMVVNRILQHFPDLEAREFHRLKRRQRRMEAAIELIEPQTAGLVEFFLPSVEAIADGKSDVGWFIIVEPANIPLDSGNVAQHVASEMVRLAEELEYAAIAIRRGCAR